MANSRFGGSVGIDSRFLLFPLTADVVYNNQGVGQITVDWSGITLPIGKYCLDCFQIVSSDALADMRWNIVFSGAGTVVGWKGEFGTQTASTGAEIIAGGFQFANGAGVGIPRYWLASANFEVTVDSVTFDILTAQTAAHVSDTIWHEESYMVVTKLG